MMRKFGGTRQFPGVDPQDPLVSIIVVVFRAAKELPNLLNSIVSRGKGSRVELIVVDGGSDDETCRILNQYDSFIDCWISEPDKGIYDAMNKGIALAKGLFIYHLNAGDKLVTIPVEELEVAARKSVDAVACRVLIEGREFRSRSGFGLRFSNTLHHQGVFYRREGLPKYNENYRVFADFDLNQRLLMSGARIVTHNGVVAIHSEGGISDTKSPAVEAEYFDIINKNYGPVYVAMAWMICKWNGIVRRVRGYRETA